jgi:hypothetical protein
MKTTMSHQQAARRIKNTYLSLYKVIEVAVKGTEIFTLFDKMKPDKQERTYQKLDLNPFEIPVLKLSVCNGQSIINTSQRFIRITPAIHESIYYEDFEGFINYESLKYEKKRRKSRTTVTFIELGFKKINGDIIYWEVPQDNNGYFFWNVTRDVEEIKTE